MSWPIRFASLGLSALLLGCASTKVEISATAPTDSFCQPPGEKLSALVLWGPIWRPDQKDVREREAAAHQGIENYFANARCFSKVEVRRLPAGGVATQATQELLSMGSGTNPTPDRLLVIAVRELGPVVKLLASPAIVEGGTEVVLELRAIDLRAAPAPVNVRVHWQHGGPWAIKGVKTLPEDMSAALEAALRPRLRMN